MTTTGTLFELGHTSGTVAAVDAMLDNGIDHNDILTRHVTGDWGNLSRHDADANDRAVKYGGLRIVSFYDYPGGKLTVITEADRSLTTILLLSEY